MPLQNWLPLDDNELQQSEASERGVCGDRSRVSSPNRSQLLHRDHARRLPNPHPLQDVLLGCRVATSPLSNRFVKNEFVFKPKLVSIHSMKLSVHNLVQLGRIAKRRSKHP